MSNFKYLETAVNSFSKSDDNSLGFDGSISIPITTILNALRQYEVGVPEEYIERDGIYFGIKSWLDEEVKKGNIVEVGQDNTYDMVGDVSVDFGFAQYESLVSDDSFVLMHVHHAEPFLRESINHNKYPAILFKFESGTSFYDVLDDITFESADIPSMIIQVYGKHYLVLPRITSESYFVKCIETGEELEPIDGVFFSGNEDDVKKQIMEYLGRQKSLSA